MRPMGRFLVVALMFTGCGSVKETATDAPINGDAQPGDTGLAVDASSCGGAGQTCCTSDACSTGLACTTSDHVCRAAQLFIGGSLSTSDQAVVARGSGTSFSVDVVGTGNVSSIYGTSASDVWITIVSSFGAPSQTSALRHWNGTSWSSPVPLGGLYYAIWGSAVDNYWAISNGGVAVHWNGSAWSSPQSVSSGIVFTQMWGSSATDVWALGQTTVAHGDGSATWTPTTRADFSVYSRNSISGRASGEWFAGGETPAGAPVLLHRSGSTFTVEPAAGCGDVRGVFVDATDAWAISGPLIASGTCTTQPTVSHREGGTWTDKGKVTGATASSTLWGTSSKNLYVVGASANGPTLFHYDGTSWTAAFTATSAQASGLSSIWGTGKP